MMKNACSMHSSSAAAANGRRLRAAPTTTTRSSRRVVLDVRASSAAAGKRALITGGNTGIGLETAKALCRQGYDVTIACKSPERAAAAIRQIRDTLPGARVASVQLDLGNQASVKECAARLLDQPAFDVLVNNAGVMATPKMQTQDGYEFQLGVNHLGHWTLTNLLLPSLVEANKPVRIVNVASEAHKTGAIDFKDLFRDRPGAYDPLTAYGQSKLANVMFTYELARRLEANPNITVNALHPGLVRTELGRYMVTDANRWYMLPMVGLMLAFFKTPEQGAQTSIHLATSPSVQRATGKYYMDCKEAKSSPSSYDVEVARRLWDVSADLTGVQVDSAVLRRPAANLAAR